MTETENARIKELRDELSRATERAVAAGVDRIRASAALEAAELAAGVRNCNTCEERFSMFGYECDTCLDCSSWVAKKT